MQRNKYLFIGMLLMIMIVVPMTTAAIESLGTFKEKDCIVLKQIAQNSTYCNISSVLAPNSSQLLGESVMTKVGTNYNYSNFCATSALGNYIVNGHCDLNGADSVWSYNFTITPTGETNNLGMYIMLSVLIVGTLLFGIMIRNIPVTILGGLLCMAFGLYTILYGFDGFRNFGTQIFSIALIAVGAILPGIGGSFTRLGYVEVLYVTEFLGLLMIIIAYTIMKNEKMKSVHANQL